MMKICGVCERPHPEANCQIFELTAEEEAALVKRGLEPPAEFVYCKACWALIKDPETGPRLMRGTAERQMLRLGVNPLRARKIADRYFNRLVELQRNRHHKTQA